MVKKTPARRPGEVAGSPQSQSRESGGTHPPTRRFTKESDADGLSPGKHYHIYRRPQALLETFPPLPTMQHMVPVANYLLTGARSRTSIDPTSREGDMIQAITDDVIVAVRIASFYPLSDSARQEMAKFISQAMVDLGHQRNFIVHSTSVETKPRNT